MQRQQESARKMQDGGVTLIADDYAMTVGVSRGILRLLEHARISGTGVMSNRPHWKGWSHAVRGFTGERDIGLHLNLTLGAPLTQLRRFAPTGKLPPISEVSKAALSLRLPLEEIGQEIAAQLDAFEQQMDRPPDFVDGHQHVHALPGIRRALLQELTRRYARGQRPWLRDPADSMARILERKRNMAKALAVSSLATGFERAAIKAGFMTNHGFAGYSAFDPKEDFATAFDSYLKAPGQRHLVMCHPGEVDDELVGLDPVVATRPQELAFLMSDASSTALAKAGLRLQRLRPLAS
jgi:chitin disaccharide deacetylase